MIRFTIFEHSVLFVILLRIFIAAKLHLLQLFQFPAIHFKTPKLQARNNTTYLTKEIWTPIDLCLDVH